MDKGISLFFSYSHKDEKLRDKLANHLKLLERQNIINTWHDRRIPVGQEWHAQINEYIKSADIILFLVSADFLASDYCYDWEVRHSMVLHEKEYAQVIPIILRDCDWHTTPFSKLQALPIDGKPVTGRYWKNQDEAFLNIADGIRKAATCLIAEGTLGSFGREALKNVWRGLPHRSFIVIGLKEQTAINFLNEIDDVVINSKRKYLFITVRVDVSKTKNHTFFPLFTERLQTQVEELYPGLSIPYEHKADSNNTVSQHWDFRLFTRAVAEALHNKSDFPVKIIFFILNGDYLNQLSIRTELRWCMTGEVNANFVILSEIGPNNDIDEDSAWTSTEWVYVQKFL